MLKVVKIQDGDYTEAIEETVATFQRGEVAVVPTDTAYGFACDVENVDALTYLLAIKKRSPSKGVSMIVKDIEQAEQYAIIDDRIRSFFSTLLPGPYTLLLPMKKGVSSILTGSYPTVAIRIPDHPFTQQLSTMFSHPYTATSANLSGRQPYPDPAQLLAEFGQQKERPQLLIENGIYPSVQFSTILDLTVIPYRITRVGVVSHENVAIALGDIQ